MMAFRTELNLNPSDFLISHSHKIITSGSCFADELGVWLKENKFDCEVNPLGTTYNPISIHHSLLLALSGSSPSEEKFVYSDELWYHFDFHSHWSNTSSEELRNDLQKKLIQINEHIKKSNVLILTYGTAWVYEYNPLKQIVSNCHKVPGKKFTKKLLSQSQISESFVRLYNEVQKINPDIRFILTVSPVRHVKDTLPLNQVSKSTLLLACYHLSQELKNVAYFPSYEILMDDLRDYRFYKSDLIHPNSIATDYIAQKFRDRYFSKETITLLDGWTQVKKALAHKPFNAQATSYKKFLNEVLIKLEAIKTKLPIDQEIVDIKEKLQTF